MKSIRKARGLSQEKFAELLDISSVAVSRLESGKTFPRPETLEKIVSGLELDYAELFTFNEQSNPDSTTRIALDRYLSTFTDDELAYILDCTKSFAKLKRKHFR